MTLESPIIFDSDNNDYSKIYRLFHYLKRQGGGKSKRNVCVFRVVMPANILKVSQLRFCGTSRDVQ